MLTLRKFKPNTLIKQGANSIDCSFEIGKHDDDAKLIISGTTFEHKRFKAFVNKPAIVSISPELKQGTQLDIEAGGRLTDIDVSSVSRSFGYQSFIAHRIVATFADTNSAAHTVTIVEGN